MSRCSNHSDFHIGESDLAGVRLEKLPKIDGILFFFS